MTWLRTSAISVCGYVLGALAALPLVCAPSAVQAQNWPQRSPKIVVPFAAGGNIDVMARLAAGRLGEKFGQQFIVENRVGGNGSIATEAVARSAPDGYMFLWAPTSTIATFPAITKVGYDPVKDFAPISLFSVAPQVLVVNPKIPAKSVAEFIAYVKAQKGKLVYAGGGGPGSSSNLIMSIFLKRAGLEMSNVSYRGTSLALTDIIAGHVPTMFVPISEALPQARAGLIRMLAVSSATRSAEAPDVPSSRRARLSRISHGLVDRHDGPCQHAEGHRRSHLGGVCRRLEGPEFPRARAEGRCAEPAADTSPAAFSAFIAQEIKLWGEAVKTAGVTLK